MSAAVSNDTSAKPTFFAWLGAPESGVVNLTLFSSRTNAIGERVSMSRAELATWLATPKVVDLPADTSAKKLKAEKERLPLFSLATFAENHAAIVHVEGAHGIAFDLDESPCVPIDRAAELLSDFACSLHTSFRHSVSAPRLRGIVWTSREITGDEHASLWPWLATKIRARGIGVGNASKDPSRRWFYPARPSFGAYEAREVRGALLDVDAVLASIQREAAQAKAAGPKKTTTRSPRGASDLERARAYVAKFDAAISGSGGHNKTHYAACQIVRMVSDEIAQATLLAEYNERCKPKWSERELAHKLESARAKETYVGLPDRPIPQAARARSAPEPSDDVPGDEPEPSDDDDAPIGRVRVDASEGLPGIWPGVDIARTVTESIDALRPDPEIFVRAGQLTRVIESDGTDPGPTREIGSPVTRRVVPQWLTERLSIGAVFMKMKTEGRGEEKQKVSVQTAPPGWIAPHIIARQVWPGFRGLSGFVTSPTIRRDGTVLQESGYDPASGLLVILRGTYRRVPEGTTREDAIAARDRLLDTVADFPLTGLGRAGWLALLFTLCARELVEGQVPLFAIDAHSAGSGKGLVVRVAHVIAFGVDIPHMSLPPDDEEFRKQITTTLLGGDAALLLDNVGVPIGGDSIEALITAPIWKARLLGKNEDSGSIPVRLVTVATGNGLQFVGDMGRRTLRIHIDTPHESPEERDDYKHPDRAGEDKLLAWVRANRAELVVDALTILRAWHVDGRQGEVKRWGSFESWASTIARCVQWIDLEDPTLGRATQDAALDPQRQALAIVYDAIKRLGTDRGVTAGDLVRAAFPPPREPPNGEDDLAEAIGALTPNSRGDAPTRARLLGRKLKAGRTINGNKLVTIPGGARSVRYAVSPSTQGAVHEV